MAKKYVKKVKLHLGDSKDALTKGIGNLRAALKENPHFPPKTRVKYELAILHMAGVHKALNFLKCDSPDMTFECPPAPLAAVAPRGRARTRRRTR